MSSNFEKTRARNILNRAVRCGQIIRPEECSECRKRCAPDGHHSDYSKPLSVIWLCKKCHAAKHPRHGGEIVWDQWAFYRPT